MFCLLWMAACDVGLDGFVRHEVQHVDLIELNHVWTEDAGQHVFSQIILWRVAEDHKFHVVAWACCNQDQRLPTTSPWILVAGGRRFDLHFATCVEHWSNYDREVADREEWPDREPFPFLRHWIRRSR